MTKNIFIIFLVLLLYTLKTYGQIACSPFEYCLSRLDSSYTFESAYATIKIDTLNKRNQWQIAVPHKKILDSALSPTHVLITDSINPIHTNDTSIVTLKIYPEEADLYLQFHQKYDIDSSHQKAYLQTSYDNGTTWVLMDNGNYQPPCDFADKFWTCGNSNSTIDGPYFYGTTSQWKTSSYVWHWGPIPVRLEDSVKCTFPPDSMLVRFVFENDSVAVANEGWMIDDIGVYFENICGGVNTLKKQSTNIYPNPANDYILIKNSAQLNYISITNLYGQILISRKEQNLSDFKIDISSLIPGIYFIQYNDNRGNLNEEKFIKQ